MGVAQDHDMVQALSTFRHVFGDRRLSDFDTQLQQLAVNARRTPKTVRQADVPDQAADLRWYPCPTATRARLPAPVLPETGPMPPDDRLRLDNVDGVQHRRKQAKEPDKEQSIATTNFGFEGTRRHSMFS